MMGVEKVADRGAGDPFCEDPADYWKFISG